eukprot:4564851-Pyramimonas_sp.AAC.1
MGARLEIVDQSDIDRALAAEGDEEKLLFSRGVFPHPGDVHPRPSAPGTADHRWTDLSRDDGDFQGNLFVDDSCTRHIIPELQRAGWG